MQILSDQTIRSAWEQWEEPSQMGTFLPHWVTLTDKQKTGLFAGVILPEIYGDDACKGITPATVRKLGLVSRYPTQ